MSKYREVVLRKPLSPVDGDDSCLKEYEGLLRSYVELDGVQLQDGRLANGSVMPIEEFNRRVGEYTVRREAYNQQFAGRIETIDMVRKNVAEIKRRLAEPLKMDDFEKVLGELVGEQSKFREIQEAEDAAFAEAAKRTRCCG